MAATFKLKIEGFPENISDVRKFNDTTRKIFRDSMQRTLITVQQSVDKKTPVGASGDLRGGTKSFVTGYSALLYNKQKYARAIEYGRDPGIGAPYDALEDWVKSSDKGRKIWAHFNDQLAAKHGATTVKQKKQKSNKYTALQIAKIMAKRIKDRGIKAQHFFRDGVSEAWPKVETDIKDMHTQISKEIMA
jgi:hypothetical protein